MWHGGFVLNYGISTFITMAETSRGSQWKYTDVRKAFTHTSQIPVLPPKFAPRVSNTLYYHISYISIYVFIESCCGQQDDIQIHPSPTASRALWSTREEVWSLIPRRLGFWVSLTAWSQDNRVSFSPILAVTCLCLRNWRLRRWSWIDVCKTRPHGVFSTLYHIDCFCT